MSFFKFNWLRMLVRRHTDPIPQDKAAVWKKRLSFIYALTAWNAFGFVLYQVYNGKADWASHYGVKSKEESRLSPAHQWTKTLGIQDATVYRVSGLNVSKYEVHNNLDDKPKKGIPELDLLPDNEAKEQLPDAETETK